VRKVQLLAKSEKRLEMDGRNKTATSARTASLRSEHTEMEGAVEMTPRGKRASRKTGPPLSTGLGNPAKNNDAGFPHFHRAGGGVYQSLSEGEKKKS
jgi:hypothetical protein